MKLINNEYLLVEKQAYVSFQTWAKEPCRKTESIVTTKSLEQKLQFTVTLYVAVTCSPMTVWLLRYIPNGHSWPSHSSTQGKSLAPSPYQLPCWSSRKQVLLYLPLWFHFRVWWVMTIKIWCLQKKVEKKNGWKSKWRDMHGKKGILTFQKLDGVIHWIN